MENLKKNLHYIVFGGGILLGLVLFAAGFVYRSGSEGALDTAANNLAKRVAVQTQGELRQVETARDGFNQSMKQAEDTLRGRGAAFTAGLPEPGSVNVGRFATDTEPMVTELQGRFQAMARSHGFPEKLKSWSWRNLKAEAFWQNLKSDLPKSEKMQTIRLQLRVIEEVCVCCELLMGSGKFPNQGVSLRKIAFPSDQKQYSPGSDTTSPWEAWDFTVELDCSPEFGYALMDELLSPSDLTSGKSTSATLTAAERRMFPTELLGVQCQSLPRPINLGMFIAPEMRAAEGIPENIDPESDEGRALAQRKAAEFERDLRPALPLHFGLKMRALNFNPKWQVVAPPAEG